MVKNKMSCQTCLTNADLCQRIAAFADCQDLLVLELVSRQWQSIVQIHFREVRNSREFKYIGFKDHDLYNTNKKMCCRISNQRRRGSSRVCVVGGSFGSLFTNCCMIEDRTDKLQGKRFPSLDIPIKLGSTASTYDSSGNILLVGGWDDMEEVILDTVYHLDVHGRNGWTKQNPINQPRCFGAAERTIQGDVLFFAGGSSPYRGADCYTDCYIRKRHTAHWSENILPPMQHTRCGHSAVTLFNDSILVAGGYAGGMDYLSSVELLDASLDRWINLPPMSVPRSGMAAVLGPGGEVYIAGGSPDGSTGHKSLERFDLREGKWQTLASMHHGRGYTAGCISTWDAFLVSGGTDDLKFQGGMESYDFRSGVWRLLDASDDDPDSVGSPPLLLSDSEESNDEDDHQSDTWSEVEDGGGGFEGSNDGADSAVPNEDEQEGDDEFEEVTMSDEADSSSSNSSSDEGGEGVSYSYLAAIAHTLLHEDADIVHPSRSSSSDSGSNSHVDSDNDSDGLGHNHNGGSVANALITTSNTGVTSEGPPSLASMQETPPPPLAGVENDLLDIHLLRGCHQMMFLL